jgi:hypothetical protein
MARRDDREYRNTCGRSNAASGDASPAERSQTFITLAEGKLLLVLTQPGVERLQLRVEGP